MAALPETMKAWQYKKYGGGVDGLQQVEIPVAKPGKNQVLLKIHASSVNPVDWKLQTGFAKYFIRLSLPVTPGLDVAGTIVAVGSNITGFKVGDRAVAQSSMMAQGALAEYATLDIKGLATLPPRIPFEDAAGLPVCATTALQGLTRAGMFPQGKGRVLVLGGSGGVGHFAVQIAKVAGCHVTATAGARNFDLLKRLGADEVLDYKNVADPSNPLQSASKEPYDVILHCTYKEEPWAHCQKVLTKKGKVITFSPSGGYILKNLLQGLTFSRQRLEIVMCVEKGKDLETLVGLAAEGKIKTVIDSTYSFADAKKAWEKNMDGHAVGKVIVSADC